VGHLLDPELVAVAAVLPKMDLSDLVSTREAARLVALRRPVYEPRIPLSVREVTVPHGAADVPVRVYAPAEHPGPLPGLLYLHGGGFVMGDLSTVDFRARMLADRAGVVVIAVDFRLAPEHPYPAPLEDTYAVLEWAAAKGEEYGIDPERLGVLGESTGGNLAAALALMTRDRQGPRLIAQFLDAPTVDDRLDTPSMTTMPDTPMWQSVNSPLSWRYYLRGTAEPGSAEVPAYAAPARAEVKDLSGLPPAFVTAYQIDPTRDEVLDFARRLVQAGVPTEIHHYGEAFHLAHIIPGTAIGARMITDRVEAIRRMLRG